MTETPELPLTPPRRRHHAGGGNGGRLTDKQRMFVLEYMVDLNPTAAARRAGFSDSMAARYGPLWVCKSRELCPSKYQHLWDAVHVAMAERVERVKVTADDVLRLLYEMSTVDIRTAFNPDGTLKAIHDMPLQVARVISGFEVEQSVKVLEPQDDGEPDDPGAPKKLQMGKAQTTKVRFLNRNENIKMLGQHVDVNAFKTVTDTRVSGGLVVEMVDFSGSTDASATESKA